LHFRLQFYGLLPTIEYDTITMLQLGVTANKMEKQ